jgi:hypothetical protein
MFFPAKAFLPPGVADQYVVQFQSLEQLPEPDYIASLREALLRQGVVYLHVSYWAGKVRVPPGWGQRRVYYVRSFVWHSQAYIVRLGKFKESDFYDWPAQLQVIWQETGIEVPDQVIEPPRST